MALFKCFKVNKHVQEYNSLGNSNGVLPSLSKSLLSSWIGAINDDIKPVVETTMAATQGMYEKARVAKRTAKYGVLYTVPCFIQIWTDRLLKEVFEVGTIGVIMKFQLQQTMHPWNVVSPHNEFYFKRLFHTGKCAL